MTPETPREAGRRLDSNEETELRQIAAAWRQEPTVAVDSGYAGLALQRLFATLDALRAAAPAPALPAAEGLREAALATALHGAIPEKGLWLDHSLVEPFVQELVRELDHPPLALAAADRAERGLPLPAGHPDTWPGGTMHMPAERGLPLPETERLRRIEAAARGLPDWFFDHDDTAALRAALTADPTGEARDHIDALAERGLPLDVLRLAVETLTPWHGTFDRDPADGFMRKCIDIRCGGASRVAATTGDETAEVNHRPGCAVAEFMRRLAADPQSPTGEGET